MWLYILNRMLYYYNSWTILKPLQYHLQKDFDIKPTSPKDCDLCVEFLETTATGKDDSWELLLIIRPYAV